MSSTSKQLQGAILKFIRERHFESGERLFSEREFAEKFDTTRPAVREAFTALEALRVVERRPQAGIYLRDLSEDSSIDALVVEVNAGLPPTKKQAEDAGEVRRILEVSAIRAAAMNRTEDDLAKLKEILDVCEEKIASGLPIDAEDEKFHKLIAKYSGNSLLLRVVNWFYEFTRARRKTYFSELERSSISQAEHKKIFNALKKGDPDKCAKLMERHILHSARIWRDAVEG
jgi:GntR family transcriptional regulator, transcriptional repressor for pyruvate dehydrogenase complex